VTRREIVRLRSAIAHLAAAAQELQAATASLEAEAAPPRQPSPGTGKSSRTGANLLSPQEVADHLQISKCQGRLKVGVLQIQRG
jgi:hypothetical protein